MRLPIVTESVKSVEEGPAMADLGGIDKPARNSPNSLAMMGALQTANCPSDFDHKVGASQNDETSDELFKFDWWGRPLVSEEQLLFTVIEVAKILKLSRTKVYELLYAGELPSVKIGASRRVRRGDLENFVSNLELAN